MTKTANLFNSRWRTAAILKIVISPYLSEKSPILMKLGILRQILNPMTVTWPKIELFNIQGGGGRHLENRFFGHTSSIDCPISAKFCMRKQNGMSIRATWQKLQIFKIQDGGRPPFWKSLNRHNSVKNRPILINLGYIRYWTRWQSRDKKLKFVKLKMAAVVILKIAFLAITYRLIVRFRRNLLWGSRTACRQGLHDNKKLSYRWQTARAGLYSCWGMAGMV